MGMVGCTTLVHTKVRGPTTICKNYEASLFPQVYSRFIVDICGKEITADITALLPFV